MKHFLREVLISVDSQGLQSQAVRYLITTVTMGDNANIGVMFMMQIYSRSATWTGPKKQSKSNTRLDGLPLPLPLCMCRLTG